MRYLLIVAPSLAIAIALYFVFDSVASRIVATLHALTLR
jgi:hypothetical protein